MIMNKLAVTPISVAILMLISCGSSKKESARLTRNEAYKVVAAQKYNAPIQHLFNDTKSHVLCFNQTRASTRNPFPSLSFFIYDLKSEKVIYEETLDNGRVLWLNENQVQITVIPGVITSAHKKEDTIYIYDLKTGQREKLTRMNPSRVKH